jgi:hypothetical protein
MHDKDDFKRNMIANWEALFAPFALSRQDLFDWLFTLIKVTTFLWVLFFLVVIVNCVGHSGERYAQTYGRLGK